MIATVNNGKNLVLFLLLFIFTTTVDILVFRAALLGLAFFLLSAPIGLISYVSTRRAKLSGGLKTAIVNTVGCALIATSSVVFGKMHDTFLIEHAQELLANISSYYKWNGKYPDVADKNFGPSKFHGYQIRYSNPDGDNPGVVFDKFNYRRQVLDVRTGILEEDRDI